MSLLPKLISKLNVIPMLILVVYFYFCKSQQMNSKIYGNKNIKVALIWGKKSKAGIMTLPYFKTYCKATQILAMNYLRKDRYIGQLNRMGHPKIDTWIINLIKVR